MGRGQTEDFEGEEVIPLDKQILEQYIDACELIKDTQAEIRKLRKRRRRTVLRALRMSSLTRYRPIIWKGLGMQLLRIRMSWIVWKCCWRSGSGTQRRSSVRWKHGSIQFRPECSGLSGTGCLRI